MDPAFMSTRILKHFGAQVRRIRTSLGMSQEQIAEVAGLHRTYIGSIERGERNVSLVNLVVLSNALGVSLESLLASLDLVDKEDGKYQRALQDKSGSDTHGVIAGSESVNQFGLNEGIIRGAIEYTHRVLDRIDRTLLQSDGNRLATLIELANLSAIIGNLFRTGVSVTSDGKFKANRPHTYPDLLAVTEDASDIEIKVALERNNPKGHLVKPGPHITVRYVLSDIGGTYQRGVETRGDVVWIWEVRVGNLCEEHFNFSNTEGDSGKTAVINSAGMSALTPAFIDLEKCPYSPNGPVFRSLENSETFRDSIAGHRRLLD